MTRGNGRLLDAEEFEMSRHEVMRIAQPAATAFLFDDVEPQYGWGARALRARSGRGGGAPTGGKERRLSAEQPAVTRWVERRAMKRTA